MSFRAFTRWICSKFNSLLDVGFMSHFWSSAFPIWLHIGGCILFPTQCSHYKDKIWIRELGVLLLYLFISIRMCNEISGSAPPARTQFTASSTLFEGDMRTLISSPNTLGRDWRTSDCPNKSEAALLISGCMFFKKNWTATASVVPWNLQYRGYCFVITLWTCERLYGKVLILPYDGLFPCLPVATKNISLCWLLKIISPYSETSSKLFMAFILSPEMLDFFQSKGNIGVRNVIPKWKFFPEKCKKSNQHKVKA